MKKGPANGKIYDADNDWNDEATLTEGSYMFSKVWAMCTQLTFNPLHMLCMQTCWPSSHF